MDMLTNLLLNLAAGLTLTLFETSADELSRKLVDPQAEAIHRVYEQSFAAMLDVAIQVLRERTHEVSDADLESIGQVLTDFIALPAVKEALLSLALVRQPLDLDRMQTHFRTVHGPDRLRNIPIDLERMLKAFQAELAARLDEEAAHDGSPLNNWWQVTTQRDLQDGQRTLQSEHQAMLSILERIDERLRILAELEAGRETPVAVATSVVKTAPTALTADPAGSIDYPDVLLTAVQRGELVPFVGAGMSMGAGLPGWYDLIADLAARSGQEMPPAQWASGDTLMRITQDYVNQEGLHSLVSNLKAWLDTTDIEPTAAHSALAQLPVNLVFTANYDDLLERAFRKAGKRVDVVVNDGDIPFMQRGEDRVNIVKLYGDLNQPRTIVLAQSQGERFFQDRPALVSLLEVELARSNLLYLGWSHADPYFNLVFGQMLNRYREMMRPGYAAMFDVPEAEVAELRRKQIRLVDLPPGPDKTAQLAGWLTGLAG